jgi:hypothetical protein
MVTAPARFPDASEGRRMAETLKTTRSLDTSFHWRIGKNPECEASYPDGSGGEITVIEAVGHREGNAQRGARNAPNREYDRRRSGS